MQGLPKVSFIQHLSPIDKFRKNGVLSTKFDLYEVPKDFDDYAMKQMKYYHDEEKV